MGRGALMVSDFHTALLDGLRSTDIQITDIQVCAERMEIVIFAVKGTCTRGIHINTRVFEGHTLCNHDGYFAAGCVFAAMANQ
jgi:hypothetical protein